MVAFYDCYFMVIFYDYLSMVVLLWFAFFDCSAIVVCYYQ